MALPRRKPNRLPNYDYSQAGYYFITLCTKDKQPLFWQPSVGATYGRPLHSDLGRIAEDTLSRLDAVYPYVRVDKWVVMPNHIHLILVLGADADGPPQVAPTVSRVMKQFKGAVSKRAGIPLWQKSFHDHVIRGEADYRRIWNYIDANPRKWREDCYYV